MPFAVDLKFLSTLLAAVAGIVVPIWLWRADLTSKSMQIRTISQTPLANQITQSVSGLSVSLDGLPLENPYLTVIEITNTGSRPIQTADFEGDIEIASSEKSAIVRVQVTATSPQSLRPSVGLENGNARIKALLLNPNDAITLSILSKNQAPSFSARARIAGVSTIEFETTPKSRRLVSSTSAKLTIGAALMLNYFIVMVAAMRWPSRSLSRSTLYFVGITSGMVSIPTMADLFIDDLGFSPLRAMLIILFITCVSAVAALLLQRQKSAP